MVIVEREPLRACDGFRVESNRGLLGWVEESWLGGDDLPDALAVRLVDGRRALILAADVEVIVVEREAVTVRDGTRVLELEPPHLERVATDGGLPRLAASWRTTGELLEPPLPPGRLRHALLELRPWRLAPPPLPPDQQPVLRALILLVPALALIIALEIALAFLVAYLVTGHPH